jgi:GDPmannose 4,6-dehydratase
MLRRLNPTTQFSIAKNTWEGQGAEEKAYLVGVGLPAIANANANAPIVAGDPTKAKEKLGWTPKTTFDELVAEMVREDLKAAERDELVKHHGYKAMDYHE